MPQPETHPTPSPEERARKIIPPNYRAETAQTAGAPSVNVVLSSRCEGGLRDAIAAAIRAAEAAARADEREACARVAGKAEREWNDRISMRGRIADSDVYASGAANAAKDIADAIRARSAEESHG